MDWPQDEASRNLESWSAETDPARRAVAEEAFRVSRRKLWELLQACIRAGVAEGGPDDAFRSLLGETIYDALKAWQADVTRRLASQERQIERLKTELGHLRQRGDHRG